MKTKIAFIQNVRFNDHRMVHTDGIARELIKKGYDVDVIIQKSDLESCIVNVPYNIIQIHGGTYSIIGQMLFIIGLFLLLIKNDYDIIHAKNPFSSVLPALLCRCDEKIIYDMRGLWIDFGVHSRDIPEFIASLLWKIEMWCMRKSDKVIAISHELKKELIKRGLNEDLIGVIVGDGVAFEEIQNLEPKDIRKNLGIEGKIIGYVGGIGHSRNSERIIEAFKYVHDEIESTKLVMIGPCKELPYFTELVNELGLTNSVFFTGFMPHDMCLMVMKSFDVAVSYHEGDLPFFDVAVPTKILEYLSCGCSIVTTDQKMYKNLLTYKKDGYLTPQDPKSFAKGIIYVLENEELSKKMSINAVATAKKYSFKTIANKVEDIYKKVLEG